MTVEKYLEDELADNSDDEKRMQKVEFQAGKKLKAAAAKTAKKEGWLLAEKTWAGLCEVPYSLTEWSSPSVQFIGHSACIECPAYCCWLSGL